MWLPKKYHYNLLNCTTMLVELKISKASNVIAMSHCPKASEYSCGIMYRDN
jgi:hypothetical protein